MKKQFRRRWNNIFIYTKITASLPFIEVDLKLTAMQMLMFINGFKYIIPCQNRLFSRQSINQIVTEQYQNISTIVKNCLNDHQMSICVRMQAVDSSHRVFVHARDESDFVVCPDC